MKNNTLIIIIALTLFGGTGIYWSTHNGDSININDVTQTTTKTTAKLVAVTDKFDFGTIDIDGGKVSTTYVIKNDGEEDITINGAETSCMCTEGEIAGLTFGMHNGNVRNVVIPAGAEEVVTATYDPLFHGPNGTGKITRVLTLDTNSVVTPSIELHFKANVIKK